MNHFVFSILLVFPPQLIYGQDTTFKPIHSWNISAPMLTDSFGRIDNYTTKIASASEALKYSRQPGMHQVQIRIVPTLNDSLGKINDYMKPISKKMAHASKNINYQTITLLRRWKQAELIIKEEILKNDSNKLKELVTIPSNKLKNLELTFKEKYVKITNNKTPGYLDSLSIRLDYLNRHILHGHHVNTADLRTALYVLANDFDNADSIKNYIQGRLQVLRNSFKANRNYTKILKSVGESLERYDIKTAQIKEKLRFSLNIETAYNKILDRDIRYQSFMKENTILGEEYGFFGKMK